jgi:thioredoxin reductase
MEATMKSAPALPIAVIGAGPVGLAAAAHLIERGLPVKVYEAGPTVGASVRDWGHIRLFSPWRFNLDGAATAILRRHGWQEPPAEAFPTGGDLYQAYLRPLAETPEMAGVVETGATVTAVSRHGIDKVVSKDRETRPFALSVVNRVVRHDLARAVIDASGTWTNPNPLGAGGVPADGEIQHGDKIAYGLPDVLGRDRNIYEGRSTLVIGAGHSAANVLLDLTRLTERDPRTSITWVVRGTNLIRVYGGGLADQLPARGELGALVKDLVDSGRVTLVLGFSASAVRGAGEKVILEGDTARGPQALGPVDRIVVATGQRPDLAMTRELRLDLDPWIESAKALGPLIDPNLHWCGSVPPHGHRELSHPEPGFYAVGVKSYGRAPTFLMATGYEQVRSIAATIAGDMQAADDVRLVLPETGVCTTQIAPDAKPASGCCGGPAPAEADACCAADAVAKAANNSGCDCSFAA